MLNRQYQIPLLLLFTLLTALVINFFNGRNIVIQGINQMQNLHAGIHAFDLAAISSVREIVPVFTGIIFCISVPFALLTYQNKIPYGKFIISLLLIIPIVNMLAVACSLIGAYLGMSSFNSKIELLSSIKNSVQLSDAIISIAKSICFALTLGLLSYFVSKLLLQKRELTHRIIFTIVFVPLGILTVLLGDISITYLFHIINK